MIEIIFEELKGQKDIVEKNTKEESGYFTIIIILEFD